MPLSQNYNFEHNPVWPVCEFDLTLRVLLLAVAFNVLITITAYHLPLYQYCLLNPRSFCKIHFPSIVQYYLVHWLNIFLIAWPMMRLQRGFVFKIAWNLWCSFWKKMNLSPRESLSKNIWTKIGFLRSAKQPLELPTYNLPKCKFVLCKWKVWCSLLRNDYLCIPS